jgi:uncharacterized protein (DUF1697 family)
MTTYITILRGINVSGHNLIKMAELKALFTTLKYAHVQTYIQSGNIVYQAKATDQQKLSATIQKEIKNTFGFEVPVITFSLAYLEKVIKASPFVKDITKDTAFLHVTFLSDTPLQETITIIKKGDYKNDAVEIKGNTIYLYCPDGYSKTKLTNGFLENKLKVTATTRNWKTTNELLRIAKEVTAKLS